MRKHDDTRKTNSGAQSCTCCSIESVVTLDERGMVCLPKDIRAPLVRVFDNGELVDRNASRGRRL